MDNKRIDDIIDEIMLIEGGYVNHPSDKGGETCHSVTVAVARKHGYSGEMRNLPIPVARNILFSEFVIEPGFDRVLLLSNSVAVELIDTGVNMGTVIAAKFFQRVLNAFNRKGELYPDLAVDGDIGRKTIDAFSLYLANRGSKAEKGMITALNALQGARYIELCEAREKNEDFAFGWIINRVTT